jgi:hypothetical protein
MNLSALDPYFPQIPQILESEFMAGLFQNVFFSKAGSMVTIEACRVGEKRYKPGKKFLVSYRVTLKHAATNSSQEQILTASLNPAGKEISCIEDSLPSINLSHWGIPSVSYLPEVGMMLWSFPNDRKLKHLPKLLDTAKLEPYLFEQLSVLGFSEQVKIISVKTKIMHYLPEDSCMIRYTLLLVDSAFKVNPQEITVYGKNYPDDSGAKTFSIMRQLAKQSSCFAKPLSYDAETRTLWQASVPGLPCVWDLAAWTESPVWIVKAAACIAEFHRCTLNTNGQFGFNDISAQLHDTCEIAAINDSILGSRINECVHKILQEHQKIDWTNSVITPIHLDLKLGNLLESGNEFSLIDMDCVQLGDHLVDIGSFVANLYLNGLRAGTPVDKIDWVVSIFCREYFTAIAWDADETKLNWYISAALIYEVVRRSIRQQDQERLQHLNAFIDLSERYSAVCCKGQLS